MSHQQQQQSMPEEEQWSVPPIDDAMFDQGIDQVLGSSMCFLDEMSTLEDAFLAEDTTLLDFPLMEDMIAEQSLTSSSIAPAAPQQEVSNANVAASHPAREEEQDRPTAAPATSDDCEPINLFLRQEQPRQQLEDVLPLDSTLEDFVTKQLAAEQQQQHQAQLPVPLQQHQPAEEQHQSEPLHQETTPLPVQPQQQQPPQATPSQPAATPTPLATATTTSLFLVPRKPKRSLTAYNLFFKDERQRLLEVLPVRSGKKPRRSHGKIGFTEMARTISAAWKQISKEDKMEYEYRAELDRERYEQEFAVWKKWQQQSGIVTPPTAPKKKKKTTTKKSKAASSRKASVKASNDPVEIIEVF